MSLQAYLKTLRQQYMSLGISYEEAHEMSLDGCEKFIKSENLTIKGSIHKKNLRHMFPQIGPTALYKLFGQLGLKKKGKLLVANEKEEAFLKQWVPIVCANPNNRTLRINCIERFKEL